MGWHKRLLSLLPLFLASLGVQAHADEPSSKTAHIPASWNIYATAVSRQLQAELGNSHDQAATRFHRFLDDVANSHPDAAPPSPIVKLWIGKDGKISSVELTSVGDAQANLDLYRIIMAAPLHRPPPPSLPQPLILRLQLTYPI
jgi:hypothetical protein